MERAFLHQTKARTIKFALVPLISVLLSQVFLFAMLKYIDVFLHDRFGITSLHRFITFLIVLVVITVWGIRRKTSYPRFPAGYIMDGSAVVSLIFLCLAFFGRVLQGEYLACCCSCLKCTFRNWHSPNRVAKKNPGRENVYISTRIIGNIIFLGG